MPRCAYVLGLKSLLTACAALALCATALGQTPPTPEERLQALEQQNLLLQAELGSLGRKYDALSRVMDGPARPPANEARVPNLPNQLGRPIPVEQDVVQTGDAEQARARVDLTQGVRLLSPDGLYRFEIHNLTQVDGRFFSPSGDPLSSGIVVPRERLIFAGQVGQYVDFLSSLQRGYGTLDLFDAYMDFKFATQFNIRVGRTKTPYSYEYYKIGEGDLIAPERSVFVGNLSPNRQVGAMALGRVWDERVEYAVGVFDGPHRSYQDFNNFKNPFLFVNARPFLLGGSDLLRYLNLGGSVNYGREKDPLEPNSLKTANDETTNAAVDSVSPTFLRFNPAATYVGEQAFWSGDVSWFYRSLSLLSQYNGGFQTFALTQGKKTTSTRVPFTGGSFTAAFFLTGEEPYNRRQVAPLREFEFRDPFRNPGAVESFSRVAYLNAGANVFTSGLADGKLWSNDALVLDNGVNWYPNRYVKLTFDWQYAAFGSRVQVSPTRFTDSENVFWMRSQLFY